MVPRKSVYPSGAAFAADEEPLEEIVVTGEFKGPGLWRVTRPGDSDNHVLWIVGDPDDALSAAAEALDHAIAADTNGGGSIPEQPA